MAILSKTLFTSGRKAVASQIGTLLRSLQTFDNSDSGSRSIARDLSASCKLVDDFPFRTLTLDEVQSPPSDLKPLIENTGMWMHLVKAGTSISSYAISREGAFEKSDPNVVSLCAGPLAAKIDQVSRWLDENDLDENSRVCILGFPSFLTYAFGILRNGKTFAILIDQPESGNKLKYEKEYSLKDFLKTLATEPNSSGMFG